MADINAGKVLWDLDIVDRGFRQGVKDAEDQAEDLDKKLGSVDFSKLASNAGNAFSNIASGIENTVKKLALLTIGSGALGAAFIGSAAQLQQTNQGFQTLIGNTEIANKLFGQLVQYANVTPFESKDITSAARTLLGFGTNAQQTYKIIQQLGDIAGATGGDFQSLALVTGQIFAQGKIQAQDFYQIINSGAGALGPLIAQNLGYKGVGELRKAFDDGKVTADSFFSALNQATTQGGFAFQGAQKQAETFNGRLSTLKDSVTQFGLALIGVRIDPQLGLIVQSGGVFDRLSKLITGLSPKLQELAPKVSGFVDVLLRNGPTIVAILEGIAAAFIVAKVAAIGFAIAAALANPFQAIALGVTVLIGVLTFLQSRFDIFGKTARGLETAYEEVKQTITDAAAAVTDFAQRIGRDIMGGLRAGIAGVKAGIDALVRAFDAARDATISASNTARDAIVGAYDAARNAVVRAFDAVRNAVVKALSEVEGWINRNKKAIENWGIVIGTLLLPKFAQVAAQGIAAAARVVAAWTISAAQTIAAWSVASARMIAQFALSSASAVKSGAVISASATKSAAIVSASATKSAAITSASWVKSAAIATAAWVRSVPGMVAQFAIASARAVASAAVTTAAWVASAATTAARWAVTFALYLAQVAVAVAGTLVAAAQFALSWLLALGPIGLIAAAVVGLAALVITNWDTVRGWLVGFWSWLQGAAVGTWNWIAGVFGGIGTWFHDRFTEAMNAIRGAFSGIGSFFTGVWSTITGIFGKVGTAIGDAISGGFKGIINTVIQLAENELNGAIKLINGAINIMNKIPKVSIPQLTAFNLPRLAAGGIVPATPGGQLAVLGEGGQDEAVIPLDKFPDVVPAGGGGPNIVINFNPSGIVARSRSELRDIAKDMIESINEELRAKRLPQIANGNVTGRSIAA